MKAVGINLAEGNRLRVTKGASVAMLAIRIRGGTVSCCTFLDRARGKVAVPVGCNRGCVWSRLAASLHRIITRTRGEGAKSAYNPCNQFLTRRRFPLKIHFPSHPTSVVCMDPQRAPGAPVPDHRESWSFAGRLFYRFTRTDIRRQTCTCRSNAGGKRNHKIA